MSKLPWTCSWCNELCIIDLDDLQERPLDAVTSVQGFICPYCESWEPVFYLTVSLKEKLTAFLRLKPDTPKFSKNFQKLLAKSENLRKRIEKRNGASTDRNMATP